MPPIKLISVQAMPVVSAVETFIACAHQMLDPSTPEDIRRATEPRLLAQLPTLRALGVFELFAVRDPALRTLLADEMTPWPSQAKYCLNKHNK